MADTDVKEAITKKIAPPAKPMQPSNNDSGSDTDPMATDDVKKASQKTATLAKPQVNKVAAPAKTAKEGSGSDTDPMPDSDVKEALQLAPPKPKAKANEGSGSDTDPMASEEVDAKKHQAMKKIEKEKDLANIRQLVAKVLVSFRG